MCGCIWDELDVGLLHLGVNAWEAHAFLGYCIWGCVCVECIWRIMHFGWEWGCEARKIGWMGFSFPIEPILPSSLKCPLFPPNPTRIRLLDFGQQIFSELFSPLCTLLKCPSTHVRTAMMNLEENLSDDFHVSQPPIHIPITDNAFRTCFAGAFANAHYAN